MTDSLSSPKEKYKKGIHIKVMEKEKDLYEFRKIDALRLYGGDTRERCSDGSIGAISKDTIYGDKDAYRTLNALLFEGSGNEQERIWEEGHKLNSDFIRRIEETIRIYTDIFTLMKEKQADFADNAIGKRIDRVSSVSYYEDGFTHSFFSASKRGYDSEFSQKNGIVLIETEIVPNTPFIDYEKILTWKQYKNLEELELLLPPFLNIEMKEVPLTVADTERVRDLNGKPPLGKYRLRTIGFPDYRKSISEPEKVLWEQVIRGKERAALLLEKMNEGDRMQDYKEYISWKEIVQMYLKIKFSQIWYGGGED